MTEILDPTDPGLDPQDDPRETDAIVPAPKNDPVPAPAQEPEGE